MTDPSTITTVEELPEPLREELVAKRAAGTTLAELKKGYPQVAPDVIRAVLPPLPKGTEPKPAPRKPLAAKPAQTAATGQRKAKPSAKAQPKPGTNGGTTDKKRQAQAARTKAPKVERKPVDAKLAQRAVTMRGKLDDRGRPTSWAKVGYALKLVPEGAPQSQASDAARRAYRQIKGENAPTGPSDY
jgi:hypothetical protein